jgi:hypothetical protein
MIQYDVWRITMPNTPKKVKRKKRQKVRQQRRARIAEENEPTMSVAETSAKLEQTRAQLARLETVKNGLDYPGGTRMLEADRVHFTDRIKRLEIDLQRAETAEARGPMPDDLLKPKTAPERAAFLIKRDDIRCCRSGE